MSTRYLTRDGDVLDDVCRKVYGKQAVGQVEAVLAANPGLADLGEVLPTGVLIVLPDIPAQTDGTVRLW